SIGTSGVLFAPLDRYPDPGDGHLHVFCHALPQRWHLMAVTLSAGGSLRWLRDLLQPVLPLSSDAAYDWLMERAGEAPPGSDGLGVAMQTTTGAGAARGAAVLAGLGVGLYGTPNIGIDWAEQPVLRPDARRQQALGAAFRTYASLYPQLASTFAGIGK